MSLSLLINFIAASVNRNTFIAVSPVNRSCKNLKGNEGGRGQFQLAAIFRVSVRSYQTGVVRNTRRLARDNLICFHLPDWNISRMSYHARKMTAEFPGKTRMLRLSNIVTTELKYRQEDINKYHRMN